MEPFELRLKKACPKAFCFLFRHTIIVSLSQSAYQLGLGLHCFTHASAEVGHRDIASSCEFYECIQMAVKNTCFQRENALPDHAPEPPLLPAGAVATESRVESKATHHHLSYFSPILSDKRFFHCTILEMAVRCRD
jgi:hypothetical protein